MHETGMIRGLVNKVEEIAKAEGSSKVKKIVIKLGAMANITPDHLKEHFVEETPGTIAEGAELEIIQMEDLKDLNAQDILIDSIEVEDT